MATQKKRWIQAALQHPGALTATAKKAGAVSKEGTIKTSWLNAQAKKGGVIGKRARLAKTLRKLGKRKKAS